MDETALIALGILMEETAREVLGETGDFAFVEAARGDEEQAFGAKEGQEETNEEGPMSTESSIEAEQESESDLSSTDGSRYSSEESG